MVNRFDLRFIIKQIFATISLYLILEGIIRTDKATIRLERWVK